MPLAPTPKPMGDPLSLCVFCGSHTGAERTYREAALRLGELAAHRGIRLVCGGGRVGLMGVMADAALAAGGEVVGVIPEHLMRLEVGHEGLSELVLVKSMHERKERMFALADAFAVLPGGLGTLDETFEILTWRLLELHDKPIILIDHEGYWRPWLELVEHVIAKGFASPGVRGLFTVVADADAAVAALAETKPPRVAPHPERL